MKVTITGLPGAGKSAYLARVALRCLNENRKQHEKAIKLFKEGKIDVLPEKRMVWSNMRFTEWVEQEYAGYFAYWSDRMQLIKLRDCDIFIDEEQLYFDAQEWQMMSASEKRFFQQHRRYGVDIYAAAQDFAQVDKSIRRVTSNLLMLRKFIGTRDISSTRPNPKWVLVLSTIVELEPEIYDETISKITGGTFKGFLLITKKDTQIFNTREEITASEYPPLRKIKRVCPEDGHVLVKYV